MNKKDKGPYKRNFYKELEKNFECPCLSGKTYGTCHKIKITFQKEMSEEEILKKIQKIFEKRISEKEKKCMINECNNIAINSHSIQKNKYINFVCEEGHAINVTKSSKKTHKREINDIGFFLDWKKEGKNFASTFWGFCKEHDDKIFSEIEKKEIEPNIKQNILLSYRATCRSLYEIKDIIYSYKELFVNFPSLAKNGYFISEWTELYSEYKQKLDIKNYLENKISNNNFNLPFIFFNFETQKNLTCSSFLWSLKDINNKRLCSEYAYFNSHGEGVIFLSILPSEKLTKVIFSCLDYAEKTKDFLQQIKNLPFSNIKSLINYLVLSVSDVGIVMNPEWYSENKNNFYSSAMLGATIYTNSQKKFKKNQEKNRLTTKDIIWN